MEDAIQRIQDKFDVPSTEQFIENHRGENNVMNPFADLYEAWIESGDITFPINKNLSVTVTYKLSLKERLKALVTGRYTADVAAVVADGAAFGATWQHEDITEALKEEEKPDVKAVCGGCGEEYDTIKDANLCEAYNDRTRQATEDEQGCQANIDGERCGTIADINLYEYNDETDEDFWVCHKHFTQHTNHGLGQKIEKHSEEDEKQ